MKLPTTSEGLEEEGVYQKDNPVGSNDDEGHQFSRLRQSAYD